MAKEVDARPEPRPAHARGNSDACWMPALLWRKKDENEGWGPSVSPQGGKEMHWVLAKKLLGRNGCHCRRLFLKCEPFWFSTVLDSSKCMLAHVSKTSASNGYYFPDIPDISHKKQGEHR